MGDDPRANNSFFKFSYFIYNVFDGPVTFFREKIVEPNQKHYPYYHQKFQRVPTIDECDVEDHVCRFEAQHQFLRDRKVDSEILSILRQRYEHCNNEDYNQRFEAKCEQLHEDYKEAAANWFGKYGDLGPEPNVVSCFMKQKHRMVWERRHGPVGSGMRKDIQISEDDH